MIKFSEVSDFSGCVSERKSVTEMNFQWFSVFKATPKKQQQIP